MPTTGSHKKIEILIVIIVQIFPAFFGFFFGLIIF